MSDAIVAELWIGSLAGAGLAAFHLATLWLTVRSVSHLPRPALFLAASAFLRLTAVALGFLTVARFSPVALAAAVVSYLATRTPILLISAPRSEERS